MSESHRGLFIVFDGPNGSGKSTQIALTKEKLEAAGFSVLVTREPGGSPGAEEVRNLVLNGTPGRWDPISEVLLFSAARRNHVETVIKPALDAGKIVLCDRFVMSTHAYQGGGHGVPAAVIYGATRFAIGDFEPNLTLVFCINTELGLQRASQRRQGAEDRFTVLELAFHERVNDTFLLMLNPPVSDDGNWILPINVPSQKDAETVNKTVISSIAWYFDVKQHLDLGNKHWSGRIPIDWNVLGFPHLVGINLLSDNISRTVVTDEHGQENI